METGSGATTTAWMAAPDGAEEQTRTRPSLDRDLTVDVCVIGAGIAGLTTAYLLACEGRTVAVLEDGKIANGESSRTTAHLSNALDDRYYEIERLHGSKGAQIAATSHTKAIDTIERIVRSEQISCGFERLDGYLFVTPGESRDELDKELGAAHRAGLTDVDYADNAPFPAAFRTGPCLRFPNQGQFHPLQYLHALAIAIEKNGGQIFENVHAEEFTDGVPARVTTNTGRVILAADLVVATNTPVNDRVVIHTKQAAYRSYVIALSVKKGSITKALYWDTPDPYHYARLADAGGSSDLLIVGGEDHKTGQGTAPDEEPEGRYAALEAWTREHFGSTVGRVEYRWSGQVMEPVDLMAFIGRNPGDKHIFVITGDSGHGMTHGTIGGMLVTDMIVGRANEWESLYDPSRVSVKALSEFASENLNTAAQYKDLVTAGTIQSAADLTPGSGGVIRNGMKKTAVYRDPEGNVHERSAICPHLGCVVRWNAAEVTWDCPCHGSRFDPFGKVLNGPANSDLANAV